MATSNFKVVCVIKCKKEEVLPIITNIKTFNTNNPGDKIKYTYIKNINSKDDEQFDHIYFKLSSSKWVDFKTIQPIFRKSTYNNTTEFVPNEEDIDRIKQIRDSFVIIKYNEETKFFEFSTRTVEKAHNYLIKKLFIDNNIPYDVKNLKNVSRVEKYKKNDEEVVEVVEETVEISK